MTEGDVRARAIRAGERCRASSFVKARAQLAATLTGASVGALRNDIELAGQRSAQWSTATGSSASSVDGDGIFDDVVASSYVKLQRFQNDASHCKPRTEDKTNAISHVRTLAREHSPVSHSLEQYPLDLARTAGRHMRGLTNSPFVSLVKDASKLVVSRDHWARAIANNATTLYSYTVPRATIWTPEGIINSISLRMDVQDRDEIIDADIDLMVALSKTPMEETEVLFRGGNLDEYRTASEPNPYIAGPSGNQGARRSAADDSNWARCVHDASASRR
ncbi:hypothetical protein [Bradyrhizobium sp. UFLA05-112]